MNSERRKPYPFDQIEPKWQRIWEERQLFHAPNPGEKNFDPTKPKFYILDMFPYPSGAGLHVGHPEGYTATDIVARYKRIRGFNVLHPMGWDAFGLPAEQYAIKTGQHPAVTTRENVAKFKSQLKRIGFSYDWQREINTTDPRYYKWTQWIFLQLYNSWFNPKTNKAEPISTYRGDNPDSLRLAYVADVAVNWCPELGTVLANEEVIDGKSEIGGHPVERRPMRQWMLRITAYAERLLDELEGLDWPGGIKLLQRNWIGRSEGAEVRFPVAGAADPEPGRGGSPQPPGRLGSIAPFITVFTTRPDTLYGATYMVLAPEHSLVDLVVTEEQWPAVRQYRERTARKSELERTDLAKEKTGVFTGAYAINPVNQERIPIWIADYVLLGYGTGAIMAVPAHDQRDLEFARKFDLPIRQVVQPVRGIGFQPMDQQTEVSARRGANLPHWTQTGATYAVTFRLVDSLPQQVLAEWEFERRDMVATALQQKRELSEAERHRLAELFSEKVERYLDAGHGRCWLHDERIAAVVRDALLHFNNERYELAAWCIMPNHVHVIVRPKGEHTLSQILHSWKSFTAKEANHLLNRRGSFWQAESFDHLIRTEKEFEDQVRYVVDNPQKAGLGSWQWIGAPGQTSDHRQDADATPQCFVGDGIAINSPVIDGLPSREAIRKITAWLEERGLGKSAINYKLRDWLFSRQRYWGEPFPIVWEGGNHRALAENELPVVPPDLDDFKPTGTGEPPLAKAKEWVRYSEKAQRETNTMPQWAGSCWYYLRFCDPQNDERFVSEEAEKYWSGMGFQPMSHRQDADATPGMVDLYVGGTEHAVLHLLYSRFWHKVLFDLGYVSKPEPFQRLVNQGMILGEDSRKMSKRWGNVIDPLDVIAEYGADAFRCYEMFMGPLEQMKPWSMRGVEGVFRFLARVWRLLMNENQAGEWELSPAIQDVDPSRSQQKITHATIKKVTADIESLSFNTAIAQMMIFVNAFTNAETIPLSALRTFLVLLNPFAPHLSSELWEKLGTKFGDERGDITDQKWPDYDERLLVENEIEIVLQVNGKVRDRMTVSIEATDEEVKEVALASPKIKELIAGKTIRKVVVVPKKLVNIVAN